jgi:hypothetical protein
LQNNLVEKFSQKNRPKIQNRFFYRFFLITFLGVSRGEFKNMIKKYRKNKSDPGPFLASDPPTHHGVPIFFGRPLDRLRQGQGAGAEFDSGLNQSSSQQALFHPRAHDRGE